jgi:two-component system LytT family sensor kinase
MLLPHALIWSAYGVVHFAASLPAILDEERGVMALAAIVRAITGFLVSLALTAVLPRFTGAHRIALAGIALLCAIVAGFAWTIFDRAALVTIASAWRVEIPWDRFIRGMDLQYFFVMAAWITGYIVLLVTARDQAQRETLLQQQLELQEVRLNLLAAQLNPHFLFNSLNTIRSLAAEDPVRTREVVTRLSSFLRQVTDLKPTDLVTLAKEVELARDYLEVEKARFEDGLEVTVNADPDASTSLVPPLILQPLLENAIKYGEPIGGIRTVAVSAMAQPQHIVLRVANTGRLESRIARTGWRLTQERLDQIFGSRHTFQAEQDANTVSVTITMPRTRE